MIPVEGAEKGAETARHHFSVDRSRTRGQVTSMTMDQELFGFPKRGCAWDPINR
jgi:hypothetical protein